MVRLIKLLVPLCLLVGCQVDYVEGIRSGMSLRDVPPEHQDASVWLEWVRVDPLFHLDDVPAHMVTDTMWLYWSEAVLGETVDTRQVFLPFEDKFSPEAWSGLSRFLDKVLREKPLLLAFLPPILVEREHAPLYEMLLETDTYWAMVGSSSLPEEVVRNIPLDIWAKAAKKIPSRTFFLPCSVRHRLTEEDIPDEALEWMLLDECERLW